MSPKRLPLRLALLSLLALALTPWASAQITTGKCSLGSASADLQINNVRARLFNNGGLFWKGAGNVYNVPKVQPGQPLTPNAIFASGIWFGGEVNGTPRVVAAAYGNWELWPGPLDDSGNLPDANNCSKYDRIFVVSKDEVKDYDANGVSTPDLEAWPVGLGAPTYTDLNGNGTFDEGEPEVVATSRDQKIDLSAGERPKFLGDQMAFWVMNDVGGAHATTGTQPMGMEVQVTAFAFNLAGALGNTTFYKYKLIYKGSADLTNAYFGVWSDPDLGNATDDWVGSDTTSGLAFVYNADNFDESSDGYGEAPPALGYDFFQGPLVDAPGETWIDPDSTVHQDMTRLGTTVFMYYNNTTTNNGNPRTGTDDWYKYLQGIWQDDKPMVDCGDGYDPSGLACAAAAKPTKFMWPGDPVAGDFWSERNFDGVGNPNPANDRRFLASTGPFVIKPGDVQEIVYGIVWAKGDDNFDSVARMKLDDGVAQSAYDNNFNLAPPPAMPRLNVAELDGSVILSWYYLPQDNNYLERYEAFNPFSFDNGGDRTYNFEGYRVYRYPTEQFTQDDAELVAIYDLENGVKRVIETDTEGLTTIVADGKDEGIQNSIRITGLTNYTQYYFGVQAYGYNGNTEILKVLESPINKVIVTPSPVSAAGGGTILDEALYTNVIPGEAVVANGEGVINARILDPTKVTGATYEVKFVEYTPTDGSDPFITYNIVNTTTGQKVLDGEAIAAATGEPVDQRNAIVVAEGLEFNVQGPPNGFKDFLTVANAAGPLDPPEYGAFAFNSSGFPHPTTGDRPDGSRQQTTGGLTASKGWGIFTFGNYNTFSSWVSRTVRSAAAEDRIFPNDFEWRFTGTSIAERPFGDAGAATMTVPFELWNVGTSPGTEDDFRLIPWICEAACGAGGPANEVFDIGGDSPLSGGADDPITDAVYVFEPADTSPGEGGYKAWEAEVLANGVTAASDALTGGEVFGRFALMGWGFGDGTAPYPLTVPEPGTIFKIKTFKPNQANDVYAINTANFAPVVGSDSVATANIDQIGIVPNPYKGASAYEVSNLQDVARFTNLPERATIRIFTLSGTLIRTIEKSGPSRFLDWDLQTEDALPIASGIYLIHVEVPGVGEKVIKFGVIKKRIQLDLL